MPKPSQIELADGTVIPILYEDRAVLAIDKPAGWMLAPDSWNQTSRNLQLALERSVKAGDFWARARGLKFIRFIHRLDAGTTGVLLLARSPGAVHPYTRLFAGRQVQKRYLAVVRGVPNRHAWKCELPLAPHRRIEGMMQVDAREGKAAETDFRVIAAGRDTALVEARPVTGRTHQIRVHLAAEGHPVLGDALYSRRFGATLPPPAARSGWRQGRTGLAPVPIPPVNWPTPAHSNERPAASSSTGPGADADLNLRNGRLALRAVFLAYPDPFTGRPVRIAAPFETFVREFGFAPEAVEGLGCRSRRNSNGSVVT